LAGDSPHLRLSSVDYHYTLGLVRASPNRQAMHPGTTVRQDCLEKNGLSVTDAARILGIDRQTLSNLLNARSGISPEMAVRLEKAFGTPAREWLIRKLDHELAEVMGRADEINVEPFHASAAETRGVA
jgi:antitoxin HigA-1